MAHELEARGREVALLVLIDAYGPGYMPPRPSDDGELLRLAAPERFTAEEIAEIGPQEALRRVLAEAMAAGALPGDEDAAALAQRYGRLYWNHMQAFFAYQPPSYGGEVVFFRAAEVRENHPAHAERAWTELAQGGLAVYVVPGDHVSMNLRPQVDEMGRKLRVWLDRVERA